MISRAEAGYIIVKPEHVGTTIEVKDEGHLLLETASVVIVMLTLAVAIVMVLWAKDRFRNKEKSHG